MEQQDRSLGAPSELAAGSVKRVKKIVLYVNLPGRADDTEDAVFGAGRIQIEG